MGPQTEKIAHEVGRVVFLHYKPMGTLTPLIQLCRKPVIEILLKFRFSSDMFPSKTDSGHSSVNSI